MVRFSSLSLLYTLLIHADAFAPCSTNIHSFCHVSTRQVSPGSQGSSSALSLGYEYPQREDGKTLYEILNASPDDTRSELKKSYVTLVRKSHPDAQVDSNSKNNSDKSIDEFQEVTQAWKVLSNPLDRKRYDRTLRAQAFTQDVESMVDNIGKTAGPQFIRAFENVAVPFLRRSAATTVAGFNAVSQDIRKKGNKKNGKSNTYKRQADGAVTNGSSVNINNFTEPMTTYIEDDAEEDFESNRGLRDILSNAVKATQEAGKAIDRLELMEKSQELRRRAKKETLEATKLKDQLDTTMRKRVNLMLHTPNAQLTSLEAMMILDGFNTVDEVTMLDSMRLRHTVSYEIEQLEQIELEYKARLEKKTNLEFDIERKTLALTKAKLNAAAALQAEERARKALEDARALVMSTREDVDNAISNLGGFAEDEIENGDEIERCTSTMKKQQEKLRITLRRKEYVISKESDGYVNNTVATLGGDFDDESATAAAEDIDKLLKEERYLRAESARLEAKAERLVSRSKKLLERSEVLEEVEEEAFRALEEGIIAATKAAESGYSKHDENKVGSSGDTGIQ